MTRHLLALIACTALIACGAPDDQHAERRVEAVGTYTQGYLFAAPEVRQFARSGRWLCFGASGETFRVGWTTTCPNGAWVSQ